MGDLRKPDFQIYDDGAKVQDDIKSAVIQITVDERLNQASICTIELRDDHGSMSDGSHFKPGADLKVELGYVGATAAIFEGEVTGWKGSFPRRGPVTLTVTGLDRFHRMRRERKQRTFLQMKDSEIASKIAGDYGFATDVTATDVKHDYIIQANECDADFLLERARRVGYELFVDLGKKLVYRAPKVDGSPVATIKWHEDMKRFAPTLSAARVPASVVATNYDMKQKKAVTFTSKKGDELSTMGGSKMAAEVATAVIATPSLVPWMPLLAPEEMEALAKGMFALNSLKLVMGEGAAQGNNAIHRGTLIHVDAIGDLLTGDYYVEAALHTLLPGSGYTTTFRVKRVAIEAPPAPPPAPAPAQSATTSQGGSDGPSASDNNVQVTLTDDEGQPLAGENYSITMPDGSTVQGQLDMAGSVKLPSAVQGTAQISFPDLGKNKRAITE
jgi:phage protein D